MASAFFLVELHHEVLVVGNGELRKREDHALAALAPDHLHVVVGTQGPDDLLLNGRALGDLLIRDLEGEVIECVTHEYGLYHCTGEGVCSWYDFASEIIRLSGVDATVAPCTSEEYKAKHPDSADRPKWSALDNRMLRCTVGNDVRDWKDALACFFTHWDGDNGMKD